MAVLIDQRAVLMNEQVVFKEKQSVTITGTFPVKIRADSAAQPYIGLAGVGGIFQLSINGMTASTFDQVTSGSGSFDGKAFEYVIHSIFVGSLAADKVYEVSITIYSV